MQPKSVMSVKQPFQFGAGLLKVICRVRFVELAHQTHFLQSPLLVGAECNKVRHPLQQLAKLCVLDGSSLPSQLAQQHCRVLATQLQQNLWVVKSVR